MIYRSDSPKETKKIASNLAAKTKSGPIRGKSALRALAASNGASIIALEGELGAGKTTFVQAFAKALGIKSKIKSPTFNIIKKYLIPPIIYNLKPKTYLYHIDCYRLKDHKEAIPLGIKEVFKEKDNIVLIEWPERISKILPKKIITVHIDHINENTRKIQIFNL